MTLNHRRTSVHPNASIWNDAAQEYWKEMEPRKPYRRLWRYTLGLLIVIAITSAILFGIEDSQKDLVIVKLEEIQQSIANFDLGIEWLGTMKEHTRKSWEDTADLDYSELRAKCREKAVRSRWHEDSCSRRCARERLHGECMNGCSYGSITITKNTCDSLDFRKASAQQRCTDKVDCVSACKTYETTKHAKGSMKTCEQACVNILGPACSRVLQISRGLYTTHGN